ncbi:F510_1955 family glycosylhydrolase [uncultured Paenibacillus sp.]|uniref:F510_1955 family glycosylhydrolase n=1 Tax=uncultured Paenibacillus sp. TaxID=227322 RepID=UPI0028D32C17|nr:glycosyl hydrolase [uncultured Paenibacillus sp.]
MTTMYLLIVTIVLFALFLALELAAKNKVKRLLHARTQDDRSKRVEWSRRSNRLRLAWIASLAGVLVSGAVTFAGGGPKEYSLSDIHGLGYSPDGQRLYIPAHNGIKVYSQGAWSEGPGEKHDYMGFSAVDDGYYSSGHPAPGSNAKNPFGLVKSTDEGKSFEPLSSYGEIDFHLMSASYRKHTVYALDPMPMSGSKTAFDSGGLYYTLDEGKTWTKSGAAGVAGQPIALAVHPSDDAIVAIGSSEGLYLSKDYGQTFEAMLPGSQVTSLFFTEQGDLFAGAYKSGAVLVRVDVNTKTTTELVIPALTEDSIAYFAQNPANEKEYAFATFNRDMYLSNDQGKSWTRIASQGRTISLQQKE